MLKPGDVHGSSVVLSRLDRIAHWKDYLAAGIQASLVRQEAYIPLD